MKNLGTIKNGLYRSLFCATRVASRFLLNDCATKLLVPDKFDLMQTVEEVQLRSATVRELTGESSASTAEIFYAIINGGYRLCEPEDALSLRESHSNQPEGEWLFIAMKPMQHPSLTLCILSIGCYNGKLCLNGHEAGQNYPWDGDMVFVFRRPKPTTE